MGNITYAFELTSQELKAVHRTSFGSHLFIHDVSTKAPEELAWRERIVREENRACGGALRNSNIWNVSRER